MASVCGNEPQTRQAGQAVSQSRCRLQELKEQIQRQRNELEELRSALAMKDLVIRCLATSLEEETVASVIAAKDHIIRELGQQLCALQRDLQQGEASTLVQQAPQGDLAGGSMPFTIIPTSLNSADYGSTEVDIRLTAYCRARRPPVLFTKLEDEFYLFGHVLLQCWADDESCDGLAVLPADSMSTVSLSEFVRKYAQSECERCGRLWRVDLRPPQDAAEIKGLGGGQTASRTAWRTMKDSWNLPFLRLHLRLKSVKMILRQWLRLGTDPRLRDKRIVLDTSTLIMPYCQPGRPTSTWRTHGFGEGRTLAACAYAVGHEEPAAVIVVRDFWKLSDGAEDRLVEIEEILWEHFSASGKVKAIHVPAVMRSKRTQMGMNMWRPGTSRIAWIVMENSSDATRILKEKQSIRGLTVRLSPHLGFEKGQTNACTRVSDDTSSLGDCPDDQLSPAPLDVEMNLLCESL